MAHDPQRQIAAYFRKGGRLTVKRAWDMFGTTELRRIVSRLRKGGMDIVSRWVSIETRDGRQQRVKEYSRTDYIVCHVKKNYVQNLLNTV